MINSLRVLSYKLVMSRRINKKAIKSHVIEEESNNAGIEENADSKNALSQFQLRSKNKLKREHVSIQYDEQIDKDTTEPKVKHEEVNLDKKLKTSTSTSEETNYNSNNRPPNWMDVVNNLREMRKDFNAPVDSMGCDRCADESAEPKERRYQLLLSLMLSSRTRDEVTFAAMERLKKHNCTIDNILQTSENELMKLIQPVAFSKNKAKFIKKSTQMLKDEYDGDIPKSIEDLCKLPGVGPKMAYLCMNTAWNEITGIGVDVHVHRISNRLGWVNTKTPEKTRLALEEWLPKELWKELNHLLVGFGQQTCKSMKPHCSTCLNRNICPFGKQK